MKTSDNNLAYKLTTGNKACWAKDGSPKEIKSCPFCGGNCYVWEPRMGSIHVACVTCGAMSNDYESSTEAINSWNRRS